MGCSPLLVWLLLQHRFREALLLVLLAGLTDWFDGFAARRLGAAGSTGAVLDPLADKALLVTLFVVLGVLYLIPRWLVELVIGRDLVIVVGSLLLRAFRGKQRFVPSLVGKISTFFQIALVVAVLIEASWPNAFFSWLTGFGFVSNAILTTVSGLGYVLLGIRLAKPSGFPRNH
jgi:cardiolipin synthase